MSNTTSVSDKLIWIDVGTHEAQEYRAVFDSGFRHAYKMTKYIIRKILLRRSFNKQLFSDIVSAKSTRKMHEKEVEHAYASSILEILNKA